MSKSALESGNLAKVFIEILQKSSLKSGYLAYYNLYGNPEILSEILEILSEILEILSEILKS